MRIDDVRKMMAAELQAFRKEVEDHLMKYPMGPDYFGLKAARNPRLVRRLRENRGVELETIQKVRDFMAQRASEIDALGDADAGQ